MVVKEADRRRQAEGLNHSDFARELGVSGGLWSQTRMGKKPLRGKLGRAIALRYTDLATHAEIEVGQSLMGR